jgi:hypothetical protein
MKLSRQLACCLLIGLVALAAVQVQAQELRGRITGVVHDNSGSVVPGVTVTATGPALIQPQTTTTGADGSYRFPALPSGVYTLSYELNGFRTVKREGIRVSLNTTLSVDQTLEVASLQEALTITGESPTVDVKTTSIGTAFTKELLTDIPNARDVWAAMAQAPGFQMQAYDVGGSHTGTQTGYMTYGLGDQNKTLVEGINVTESTNANAGYFDFGSFEEFQLGGAGNMGEQSGPGALLNLTVKSGGDKFGGEVYFDFENDKTIGDNVPSGFKAPGGRVGQFAAPTIVVPGSGARVGLLTGNPITKQYDLNIGVGGPIIKKKLWFFASYRDNNQYKTILGLPGESAQSKLENWTGKLTYQVNPRHKFVGFFNQRTKLQPLRDLSLVRPVESAHWQASKNRPYKFEWEGVLSDRLYANLQVSNWGNYFPLYPTQTASQDTTGVPIGRVDLATGQQSGAHSYYHNRITEKPQLSGNLSYFKDNWAGSHSFKFGFEAYRERRTFERFQPGNVWYRDRNGIPEDVLIYNTPNAAIDDSKALSLFLQDGWSLNRRLTLNLGVRYDRYELGWPEQNLTPAQAAFFPPVSTPSTTVAKLGSASPRVGFAWDITGRGRTVAKAFFGRYYYNTSTDIGTLQNPISAGGRRYQFTDRNGNKVLDGADELGRQLATFGGGGAVTIDPNLKHAYGQEISTHIEHEIARNISARGSYVYKGTRNGWAQVDVERVNAYTIPFTFLDVGPDNAPNTADDRTLQLLDRPASAGTRILFTNPGNIAGVPAFEGDYHTVEFALNRRMKNKWMLLTSFEHTWSNDFRTNSSSTSALSAVRTGGPTYLWRPNQRRFGKEKSTFWNYKLLGRYELPWQLAVAASFKYQSGFNYARTIAVPLPGAGNETINADPVFDQRAPNVPILDVRAEKAFSLGGSRKIALMVDVFNALNADTIANFRVTSGARYNELIALLDPRAVRFGARLSF